MQADLLDYLNGTRSIRELYGFLDQLPPWGAYKSALAMDEDWAQKVLELEERTGELMPGFEDSEPDMTPFRYSDIVARMDLLADRVLQVIIAVQSGYADNAAQVPSFEPMRRPLTAIEKERERRELSVLAQTERMIFGGLALEGIRIEEE